MLELSNISSVDVQKVALPDISHLYGAKVIGNVLINLSEIYYDDEGNNVREHGQTSAHVESLKMSFAEGVDISVPPPAVIVRQGPSGKKYELLYGFHRWAALMELGVKTYIFTLIECINESVERDVKIWENEDFPKATNSELDIKSTLIWKITKGYIKNAEESIRKEIKRICPYRKKESIDRIIQMVFHDANTPQKFSFYSPAKAQSWLDNHSTIDYTIGSLDETRDMYGYLVKEGYHYRFVMNAIRNYAKTGKKSYCIVHVGSPTGNSTIDKKRRQFVDELKEITENFLAISNDGFVAWEIMGFLPQIREVENWKSLIEVK